MLRFSQRFLVPCHFTRIGMIVPIRKMTTSTSNDYNKSQALYVDAIKICQNGRIEKAKQINLSNLNQDHKDKLKYYLNYWKDMNVIRLDDPNSHSDDGVPFGCVFGGVSCLFFGVIDPILSPLGPVLGYGTYKFIGYQRRKMFIKYTYGYNEIMNIYNKKL